MRQALQTVKDFSPYGWGLTLLVLLLDTYNQRNPPNNSYVAEYDKLSSRVTVLESKRETDSKTLDSLQQGIRNLQIDVRDLHKIGCASLSKSQKLVLSTCD